MVEKKFTDVSIFEAAMLGKIITPIFHFISKFPRSKLFFSWREHCTHFM